MKNLLLTIVALVLISCARIFYDNESSQRDPLPAVTQTGANTAGCYIGRKLLIPKDEIKIFGGQTIYGLTARYLDGKYQFNIRNNNNVLFIYMIDISNGVGNYQINQSNGVGSPLGNHAYLKTNNKLYLSSNSSGSVTITKFDKPIVSGLFSATLYNKDNPSERIQIKDGRFDINEKTLNSKP